jgi:hypothetical protein
LRYNALMKRQIIALALLFSASLPAQAPVAVPVGKEPHHHLVFGNDYLRVFRVSVPPHDATLLHQHDLPYVYVSLGPADVINAVAGKPEARLVMTDGQVGYSRGGFAHIARTDAGSPFDNVTIELLHPQGEPHNVCEKVVAGPFKDCGNRDSSSSFQVKQLFYTDEIQTDSLWFAPGANFSEPASEPGELLIAYQNTELRVDLPGKSSKSLRGGEVLWIDAGKLPTIITAGENKVTRFLLVRFKGSNVTNKP